MLMKNKKAVLIVMCINILHITSSICFADHLYVVKFGGPIQKEWKAEIKRSGLEIGDYLGNSNFVVSVSPSYDTRVLLNLPYVKSFVPLKPERKLDTSLKPGLNIQRLEIYLWSGTDGTTITKWLQSLGGNVVSVLQKRLVADLDMAHIGEVAARDDVTYIRRYSQPKIQSFLDQMSIATNVAVIWNDSPLPFRGREEILAVNDIGVYPTHPALMDAILLPVIDAAGDNDVSDFGSHGTYTSGVIASRGINSLRRGIAPEARLVVQAMWNNQRASMTISEPVSNLFQTAMARGAKLQNNSWGTFTAGQYSTLSADVDAFVYANPEATLVFATGPGGDVADPAIAKNVIAVGEIGGVYKATVDDRPKPDIFAPSSAVSTAQGGGFIESRGSSVSAAVVSGALALIRSYYGLVGYHVHPSAALLKATLINGQMTPDRFDVTQMMDTTGMKQVFEDNPLFQLGTGDEVTHEYEVSGGEPFRVTLAWSDFPASPLASRTLVNDLDLTMIDPSGQRYIGGGLEGDHMNNVEKIAIDNPDPGRYKVIIRGYNVPYDFQKYALVVRGKHITKVGVATSLSGASTIRLNLLGADSMPFGPVVVKIIRQDTDRTVVWRGAFDTEPIDAISLAVPAGTYRIYASSLNRLLTHPGFPGHFNPSSARFDIRPNEIHIVPLFQSFISVLGFSGGSPAHDVITKNAINLVLSEFPSGFEEINSFRSKIEDEGAGDLDFDDFIPFGDNGFHYVNPSLIGSSRPSALNQAKEHFNSAVVHYATGDKSFAFKQLGRVLHLIEDMASPTHVHNLVHKSRLDIPNTIDPSPVDDFEELAEAWMVDVGITGLDIKKFKNLNEFFGNLVASTKSATPGYTLSGYLPTLDLEDLIDDRASEATEYAAGVIVHFMGIVRPRLRAEAKPPPPEFESHSGGSHAGPGSSHTHSQSFEFTDGFPFYIELSASPYTTCNPIDPSSFTGTFDSTKKVWKQTITAPAVTFNADITGKIYRKWADPRGTFCDMKAKSPFYTLRADPTFVVSGGDEAVWEMPDPAILERPLAAHIAIPVTGNLVRADVPVSGIASGSQFHHYRVEMGQGANPQSWTLVDEKTEPQVAVAIPNALLSGDASVTGNLATWHTGLTEYVYPDPFAKDLGIDGVYTVRLVVSDTDGNSVEDRATVTVGRVLGNSFASRGVSPDKQVEVLVQERSMTRDFSVMGIVPEDTTINHAGLDLLGTLYRIRPDSTTFIKPVELSMKFSDLTGNTDKLGIYRYRAAHYNPRFGDVPASWELVGNEIRTESGALIGRVKEVGGLYGLFYDQSPPIPPTIEFQTRTERVIQIQDPVLFSFVRGMGTPGNQVRVRINGNVIGEVPVGVVSGFWELPLVDEFTGNYIAPPVLSVGDNIIDAVQVDQAGNTSLSSEALTATLSFQTAGFEAAEIDIEQDTVGTAGDAIRYRITGNFDPNQSNSALIRATSASDPRGILVKTYPIYPQFLGVGPVSDPLISQIGAQREGEKIRIELVVNPSVFDEVAVHDQTPPDPPRVTSTTHPALVMKPFETGLDAVRPEDGSAEVYLEDIHLTPPAQAHALRIGKIADGGMEVVLHEGEYFLSEFPVVSMDYKFPPELQLSLLALVDGVWYDFVLADPPRNYHKAGIVADNTWRQFGVNLYSELVQNVGHSAKIQKLVLADWDVTGYRRLSNGSTPVGTRYSIDNFAIVKPGGRAVTLSFEATDPSGIREYEYRIGKNSADVYTAPANQTPAATAQFELVGDGLWTVQVIAIDAGGNQHLRSSYTLYADAAAPVAENSQLSFISKYVPLQVKLHEEGRTDGLGIDVGSIVV